MIYLTSQVTFIFLTQIYYKMNFITSSHHLSVSYDYGLIKAYNIVERMEVKQQNDVPQQNPHCFC